LIVLFSSLAVSGLFFLRQKKLKYSVAAVRSLAGGFDWGEKHVILVVMANDKLYSSVQNNMLYSVEQNGKSFNVGQNR
jgi:hypothetical protein